MPQFSHLHCHTQYSLLDGAASIDKMIAKAVQDNMPAIAITDHGNMFGVFEFVSKASQAGIKPIVGCEFYVVEDRFKKQFTKEDKDIRYHQLMLAKNEEGYRNLNHLCSLGFTEGFYSKYPRIDKQLILKHHKGLIATTCCLGAEIPRAILRKGEAEAEKLFQWWLDLFGEDYYVELQRHDIPDQHKVNEVLLRFAAKYQVSIIASNDSHYIDQEDWDSHDTLLCLNTGSKKDTPAIKDFADDEVSMRNGRFAFYNDQFYFKTTEEMSKLFHDLPQAIDNTNAIVDKVTHLNLKKDILLPNFPVPQEFKVHDGEGSDMLNQWEYLKHLTFEGARKRYGEINAEVEERLNFELFTIKTMGFAGYFLIVADFIQAGRNLGVFVGPGRGSAAGSVVAYCIGITNIDPIKYDLLFERFLNPDRKSMPDIDTDFDDEGRQKVIAYVVNKYGMNQVAQIVTFGTMAARSSVKDVARVLDLSVDDGKKLASLIPEKLGITLDRVLNAPIDGEKGLKEKEGLQGEDIDKIKKARALFSGKDTSGKVFQEALKLTGCIRNTSVHAAGVIIAPTDLKDIMPIATSKDSELYVTQYDGRYVENAGVIKMDFLGLKNLSIIKDTLALIERNHHRKIDIDAIPLDDQATLELFQRGETNGVFQFESIGMQKYLKELKPDKFADLIAMNALYRPGPLAYIPNFIRRKHGQEEVTYDLPEMEEILKDTYGITVYQEQVMLLSQRLAGFSKGDADVLRKAMGKKDRKTLDKLKPRFIDEAGAKGLPKDSLEKIWTDWEAFASYAFNKSHSTCYAFVAFQTAYLKAHYPAEYMAAVLSRNQDSIDNITFFLEECRRIGIKVLGPDLNESLRLFNVNNQGAIRFGLGAIKGTGDAAVEAIITERDTNGAFKDVFDFAKRMSNKSVNKKTFEALAQAGALDVFSEIHRAQYFHRDEKENESNIEKIIRYGNQMREEQESGQFNLFGQSSKNSASQTQIKLTQCKPWTELEKLRLEKEVIGFYVSGHPLETFKREIAQFCSHSLGQVASLNAGQKVSIAGAVSRCRIGQSKTGNPYVIFTLEDLKGSIEIPIFGEDFLRQNHFIKEGYYLFAKGIMESRMDKRNPDAPPRIQFKPQQFILLDEVAHKLCKSVALQLEIDNVYPDTVAELERLAGLYKGNCDLKIKLSGTIDGEKISIDLSSRKYRISPERDFLDALEQKLKVHVTLES